LSTCKTCCKQDRLPCFAPLHHVPQSYPSKVTTSSRPRYCFLPLSGKPMPSVLTQMRLCTLHCQTKNDKMCIADLSVRKVAFTEGKCSNARKISQVDQHLAAGTVLTCGKDNLLKTVNPQTFEVRQTFRAPQFSVGTIWCTACISPDGQHVAAGSGNGSLFVWNVSPLLQRLLSDQ